MALEQLPADLERPRRCRKNAAPLRHATLARQRRSIRRSAVAGRIRRRVRVRNIESPLAVAGRHCKDVRHNGQRLTWVLAGGCGTDRKSDGKCRHAVISHSRRT